MSAWEPTVDDWRVLARKPTEVSLEAVGLIAYGELRASLKAVGRALGRFLLGLDTRVLVGPGATRGLADWLFPTPRSGKRLMDR